MIFSYPSIKSVKHIFIGDGAVTEVLYKQNGGVDCCARLAGVFSKDEAKNLINYMNKKNSEGKHHG